MDDSAQAKPLTVAQTVEQNRVLQLAVNAESRTQLDQLIIAIVKLTENVAGINNNVVSLQAHRAEQDSNREAQRLEQEAIARANSQDAHRRALGAVQSAEAKALREAKAPPRVNSDNTTSTASPRQMHDLLDEIENEYDDSLEAQTNRWEAGNDLTGLLDQSNILTLAQERRRQLEEDRQDLLDDQAFREQQQMLASFEAAFQSEAEAVAAQQGNDHQGSRSQGLAEEHPDAQLRRPPGLSPARRPSSNTATQPKVAAAQHKSRPFPNTSRTAAQAHAQGVQDSKAADVERRKRVQEQTRRPSLIRGDSNFGDYHGSRLLQKSVDSAAAAEKAQLQRSGSAPSGSVVVGHEFSPKTQYRMNAVIAKHYMAQCIKHDSRPENIRACPIAHFSPSLIVTMLQRLRLLAGNAQILADIGLDGLVVPTEEVLKELPKEEAFFYISASMVPFSQREADGSWRDCLRTHEIKHGFKAGEVLGTLDKDRIAEYYILRTSIALEILDGPMPQWSKQLGADGKRKHCVNFVGQKNNSVTGESSFWSIFHSGALFPQEPRLPDGTLDKHVPSLRKALLVLARETFEPTATDRDLTSDIAYTLGTHSNILELYHIKRRENATIDCVYDGGNGIGTPMMHQSTAFTVEHPGRVVVDPSRSFSQPQQQPPRQPPPPKPPDRMQTQLTQRYERERGDAVADSLGVKQTPSFWTNAPKRSRPSEPPAPQRLRLNHMSVQEQLYLIEDQRAQDELADFHERQEDEYNYLHGLGPYAVKTPGDDDDMALNYETADEGIRPDEGRSVPYEPPPEYFDEAATGVFEALAAFSVANPEAMGQLPGSVQQRVATLVAHQRDAVFAGHNNTEPHRNDDTKWSSQRNSANSNSGRIYEPVKRVAFSNTNANTSANSNGYVRRERACQQHLFGQCKFEKAPDQCPWSHDQDICDAAYAVLNDVNAARIAARIGAKKAPPPPARANVAAMSSARSSQQRDQVSEPPRRHSSADNNQRGE